MAHSYQDAQRSQNPSSMALQDQFAALEQEFMSKSNISKSSPQLMPTVTTNFDPRRLIQLVLSYRWVIVTCLILGVIGGLLYTKTQRMMYQSTSKVEIITSSARVLRELEISSQGFGLVVFETARQKILSRDVAERVVEKLNLAYDPTFLANVPKFSLAHIFNSPLDGASRTDISGIDAEVRRENAVALVRKNLSARLLRNTSIIAVTYHHPSPAYSRAVANAVASAYIDLSVDKKLEVSNQARTVLEQQSAFAKTKLEKSEQMLVTYAEDQDLTVVGDNSDLLAGNINEINRLIAHSVNERLLAERYYLQLKQNGAASLPQSYESNTVQAAKDKLIDLKAQYQQGLATLKPGFPSMRKLSSQIRNVERSLNREIKDIGSGIKIQLDQARSKEDSLRLELRKLEEQKRAYERKNIQYAILRRETESNRAHYQSLIKKLSEVGVGASLKTATASIVDAADFPQYPASPRLLVNLLASMMLFSFLGAFFIYAREMLNDSYTAPEQLTDQVGLPVLGIIPHATEVEELGNGKELDDATVEEAYRILRATVQHTGGRNRTMLVTSAHGGEGKSLTARQLAQNYARLGTNVLLIDANFRQPDLHTVFDATNDFGFANMLNNTVEAERLSGCFKQTHLKNLTVLPAGNVTSNPSDLLACALMPKLLAFFTRNYDLVIMDSSCVNGFADVLAVSRECDATLFVVASDQTERSKVRSAISQLHMNGGNVIGTVFTKLQTRLIVGGFERKYARKLSAKWQDVQFSRPTASGVNNRSNEQRAGTHGLPGKIWRNRRAA